MSNDPFERDLRSLLVRQAPLDVPASLHAHVAALQPGARESWVRRLAGPRANPSRWLEGTRRLAVGGLAVLLVAAIAGLALLSVSPAPDTTGPAAGGPKQIVWQTNLARLEADSIAIETAEHVFRAAADRFAVTSDPGSAAYRTLEISWREHEREMRLNLYFAANATHWWVRELRVYDGRLSGEWISFAGPLFATQRGHSFVGDIDLSGRNKYGSARLRIEGARLTAFVPGTGPKPFENCRFIGPAGRDMLGRPVPQPADPDLSEFGLVPGMDASAAYDQITRHAICYEFRLEFPALNQGQRWCVPPPGRVREFLFGSSGELLVFVEDRARTTSDPNMPDFIGCQ